MLAGRTDGHQGDVALPLAGAKQSRKLREEYRGEVGLGFVELLIQRSADGHAIAAEGGGARGACKRHRGDGEGLEYFDVGELAARLAARGTEEDAAAGVYPCRRLLRRGEFVRIELLPVLTHIQNPQCAQSIP